MNVFSGTDRGTVSVLIVVGKDFESFREIMQSIRITHYDNAGRAVFVNLLIYVESSLAFRKPQIALYYRHIGSPD